MRFLESELYLPQRSRVLLELKLCSDSKLLCYEELILRINSEMGHAIKNVIRYYYPSSV